MAAVVSRFERLKQWRRERRSANRVGLRGLFSRLSGGSSRSQDSEDSNVKEATRVPIRQKEIQELHFPNSAEALKGFLTDNQEVDLNAIEPSLAKAPIHSILTGNRAERNKLLETLLTYGEVDVDLKDLDGNTPLHVAIKNNDFPSIKMLVAFGADVNIVSGDDLTPTELCKSKSRQRIFLRSMHSWTGVSIEEPDSGSVATTAPLSPDLGVVYEDKTEPPLDYTADESCNVQHCSQAQMAATPPPDPFSDVESSSKTKREEIETDLTRLMRSVGGIIRPQQPPREEADTTSQKVSETINQYDPVPYDENSKARALYRDLDDTLRERADSTTSISGIDSVVASAMQRTELSRFKKTGSRILCLDGGGMKGLIELDVMESIEQQTGKSITELFDWIVGTSTGGILALGLVYAKKSIWELRQLFFRMKDEVFANPKFGIAYNSEALERMLIEALGSKEMRMGDIKNPKVLVAATYKGSTPLQLHLFNNCLENEHSNEVVWEAARATCAGPLLFSEFNNYVDGGVLCNNPTEKAITAIQNYHWQKGEKLPISLIVSIGCGIYPDEKLGNVDALDNLSLPRMRHLKTSASNLMELFSNALGVSELVAEACEHNFREQDIPYYRFSPHIDESIKAGETDSRKLIDMIIQARQQTVAKVIEMVDTHLSISTG